MKPKSELPWIILAVYVIASPLVVGTCSHYGISLAATAALVLLSPAIVAALAAASFGLLLAGCALLRRVGVLR